MTDAARPAAPSRQVIHVGFDSCGGQALARLFRRNGLPVLCWDRGHAAREIAYLAAANRPPVEAWHGLSLLAELHSHAGPERPPVEAFRELDWIDRHFPGALIVMTTREIEPWLAERLTATDLGRSAPMTALHRGCAVADLPQLWTADWNEHLNAVRARFGATGRYVELAIDRLDEEGLRRALAPHVPGLKAAGLPMRVEPADPARALALVDDDRPPVNRARGMIDAATIDRLVAHCVGRIEPGPGGVTQAVSGVYAWFNGRQGAWRRDGSRWPLALTTAEPRRLVARPGPHKIERIEGVANDLRAVAFGKPFHIDMQDGRRIGSDEGEPLAEPVLAYNRRVGAQNVVLWPLPGLHAIGNTSFALPESPDDRDFADKLDAVVWRGSLSGNSRQPDGTIGPAAHTLFGRAARTPGDPAAWQAAGDAAATIPRAAILSQYADRPDMDLGLVPAMVLQPYADRDPLARLARPRLSRAQMLAYRYQLCLSGFDVGTNFIWAANSNSVVLKEEAGWEVYYSALFRPWEHYIPLEPGCPDLPERLDWARANPAACRDMTAAARAAVRMLSDRGGQLAMMRAVAETLPPATFPF